MGSWIQRSKDTLCTIIDSVKKVNSGLKVRVSFVGYRDFELVDRFSIIDFNEDLDLVKAFIGKVNASSAQVANYKHGLDLPEDVQGGMN